MLRVPQGSGTSRRGVVKMERPRFLLKIINVNDRREWLEGFHTEEDASNRIDYLYDLYGGQVIVKGSVARMEKGCQ